ncbi:hypothetical protein CC1G_00627 [Coprinopsis cinerea okayama7|uniref:Uncharacterized protein n=1 Tax=Coprinopsis cinerea (strain Okayama-7 / 130 / ATCC MYA-4618 / FGSC 9003) TaxID=240176 RepID=A8N3K8_COPC7|nr:hypothetical protein CC1G_00627 [Coprinopsis cinerea okayama7\|eukprot:XP_001829448.1 hypothetical protein CC1G_00627 [Coprinopsis cinerea okayama7\
MPHSAPRLHPSRTPDRDKKKSSQKPSPTSSTPKTRRSTCDSDDKASILSRSTHFSTGTATVNPDDPLRGVAGDRVRHAKCAPDFLEGIAVRDDAQVRIITGVEASTFFVKYLGEQDSDAAGLRGAPTTEDDSRAIVFAVTAWDRNRKCVDYYMTWRRKNNNPLKEKEIEEIDDEFRRVAKRIDKDYKAFRRAGSASSVASSTLSRRNSRKRDRSRSPQSTKKTRPEPLPVPTPEAEPTPELDPKLPEPPASATDSVISLPYLTHIRGVPRGNRLPLLVTNPDPRLSIYSELDSPIAAPEASDEQAKQPAELPAPTPLVISITPPDTNTPNTGVSDPEPSGLTPILKSSASIRSTETRSSKSSRSSRDSSPPHSPSREDDKLPEESKYQFLIVLLGEQLEKGLSWHGLERQVSTRSQNKANTKERSSPWIDPSPQRVVAPTAYYQARKIKKRSNYGNDSDSDASYDEEGWKDSPVVPLKPLLESMGFVPSPGQDLSGYHSPPVIPLGMPFNHHPGTATPHGSVMASPAPSAAMQLRYSTYSMHSHHTMSPGSPYVPAWMSLGSAVVGGGNNGGSQGGSHPPSRAASTLGGYGSPYMRPAY